MEDNNDKDKKAYIKMYVQEPGTSKAPQYEEKYTRGGWISYGADNLYPDYLISLMNRSGQHNAILERKSMMIAGNGWNKDGLDGQAAQFIANPYNEFNLDEIAYRCAYDLELFGAFSLEVLYSKDRSKIAEIKYLPNNKIRLSDDGSHMFYSNDWSNLRKFAPIKQPIFNTTKNLSSGQILYTKSYRPGVEFYGQPGYLPCVNWIELEYEVSCFHLNQVRKGFSPQLVINFAEVPTQEEIDDTIKRLKNDYKGAQGEVIMFTFGTNTTITPIDLNDSDERFIELNKEMKEGMFIGHNITNPELFAKSVAGELGNKSTILESLEIFQSSYITPRQIIIENTFNKLLKVNGSSSKLKLNKYQLDLTKIETPTNG